MCFIRRDLIGGHRGGFKSGGKKVAANQPTTNDWSNANVRWGNGIKYTLIG